MLACNVTFSKLGGFIVKRLLPALLSCTLVLSLVTIAPVNSEEPGLWLPDGFDWDVNYSMVCDAFYGRVYETLPVQKEEGTYTGIMAGETSEGFMFTFCNDKLVGVSVAYGDSYPGIPSISDIDSAKGYTKTYESRSGNWTYIESGIKGYQVLNWDNNLGMKSVLVTK